MRAAAVLALLTLATVALAQDSTTTRNVPLTVEQIQAMMPQPAVAAPPSVADSGAVGTGVLYALSNHTHASKARKGRVLVPISGSYDLTFSPAFNAAPICTITAETTLNDTNVVNGQIDGPTSTTGARIRVTRTAQSVVALLGLTILSVPTQVATYAHYICIEP